MSRNGTATAEIEGEAVEVETRAMTVVPDEGITGAGTFALAAMSDADFSERLTALVKHRQRVAQIQRALMTKDVHYGIIPGTDKPTLFQPGAELLCDIYRLRGDFAPQRTIGDGIATPHLSYLTRCDLHLGSLDGPVVATGYGAANSWEKRYRYRNAERVCPNCGKPAVIKGKAEYGGGWLCWPKKDGCNSKWRDGDQAIEGQTAGQVDNPDPFDLDVVLDAMAAKRAFVHATRRGCAVSDLFTSDVEDLPDFRPPDPDPAHVDRQTGEIRRPDPARSSTTVPKVSDAAVAALHGTDPATEAVLDAVWSPSEIESAMETSEGLTAVELFQRAEQAGIPKARLTVAAKAMFGIDRWKVTDLTDAERADLWAGFEVEA